MATTTAPGPRWRVEEVARRVDVSVDTIRFYQKRRLLPPPAREGRLAWYGEDHLERLARIRDLQREGFSLAVIRRLLDGELDPADVPLAAAVAGAGDAEEELLTVEELAARSGVPLALVEAAAAEGLLLPRVHDGEPRYAPADVDVVRAGRALLDAGLPLPELLALARRHHEATRGIAESAVAMFDAHVREPLRESGLPDDERASLLVDAFSALLPAVSTLVAHHFRSTLLAVAQEHLEAVGEPSTAAPAEAAR